MSNIFAELKGLCDNVKALEHQMGTVEKHHRDLDEDLDKLLKRVAHLEDIAHTNQHQLKFLVSAVTAIYQFLEPPHFSATTGISIQVLP